MHQLSAVVLVSLSLAACGGSSTTFTSGSSGGAGGAPGSGGSAGSSGSAAAGAGNALSIEQLPSEFAQALCQAEQTCNPFFYGVAFQNQDCKAVLTEQVKEAVFTQIDVAIDAGTVKYDGKLAGSCIQAMSLGSCTVLDNQLPEVCRQALAGTVATGGECNIDAECSGLSRCQISAGTCPGKCAPLASAGVACNKDGDCARGLTCSAVTAHCSAPAAEGEPCKGGSAAECKAGLLCIGNDDGQKRAGSCQTAAMALTQPLGQACDLQQGPWCAENLACVVESYSMTTKALVSKCHAVAPAGGDCGLGIPGECPAGQYCPLTLAELAGGKFSAKCLALPGEGEACAPGIGFVRCAGELVCDDSTTPLKPVCVPRHTLGQSCTSNALCNSGHCVDKACVPESVCAK